MTEADLSPKAAAGDQCWVSLIGESDALQARRSRDPDLLRQQGIEVLYHEIAEQRSTYVVDAGQEVDAVRALYRDVFENV